MRILLFLPALLLLGLASCSPPRPQNVFQAVAAAENYQEREGLSWGMAWSVIEPSYPNLDGRIFIQVAYAPDPASGDPRIILVNRDTGWVRLPPQDYVQVPNTNGRPVYPSSAVSVPGDAFLVVTNFSGTHEKLIAKAKELSALCPADHLAPLFSIKKIDDQERLIYGRQGSLGLGNPQNQLQRLQQRFPDLTFEIRKP